MNNSYFDTSRSITIDSNDLDEINFYLGQIAKLSDAGHAVADTLAFLQNDPIKNNLSSPPYPGKEAVGEILSNTLGSFMENRGATIKGLISMIEIIAGSLEDARARIAVIIKENTNGEELKSKENVTGITGIIPVSA
jgi:hypothetical protein